MSLLIFLSHLGCLGRHMQRRVLQPAPGLQVRPGVQQHPEHLEVTHASRQVQGPVQFIVGGI